MGYVTRDANGQLQYINADVGATRKKTANNATGATIPANSWVALTNVAGVLNMVLADGGVANIIAEGVTTAAIITATTGDVLLEGTLAGFAGLTPGSPQFLSSVAAGAMVEIAPTASNTTVQFLGIATSATEVDVKPAPLTSTIRNV